MKLFASGRKLEQYPNRLFARDWRTGCCREYITVRWVAYVAMFYRCYYKLVCIISSIYSHGSVTLGRIEWLSQEYSSLFVNY